MAAGLVEAEEGALADTGRSSDDEECPHGDLCLSAGVTRVERRRAASAPCCCREWSAHADADVADVRDLLAVHDGGVREPVAVPHGDGLVRVEAVGFARIWPENRIAPLCAGGGVGWHTCRVADDGPVGGDEHAAELVHLAREVVLRAIYPQGGEPGPMRHGEDVRILHMEDIFQEALGLSPVVLECGGWH